MDVIALVGPSGTGKSHRALLVAHEHKADAIIDDGILIKDGKIIAGHSAKREPSKIMAVRRAIFILPGHAEEVRAAIEEVEPHRILILGTSENMVYKIAKILGLPSISKIVHIEDIAIYLYQNYYTPEKVISYLKKVLTETYKLKEPVIQEPTNPDTDGTTDTTMDPDFGI